MLGTWSTGNGRRQARERERGRGPVQGSHRAGCIGHLGEPRLAVVPTVGRCSQPLEEALGAGSGVENTTFVRCLPNLHQNIKENKNFSLSLSLSRSCDDLQPFRILRH